VHSGGIVIVPGRIAALLERYARLDALRVSARGQDPQFDEVMVALHIAAVQWRTSAVGTKQAPIPEVGPSSLWVGSAEAELALRITPRAVVLAISEGRLRAEKVSGQWRISREDLTHFTINRSNQ